jgi:hypothetical protein
MPRALPSASVYKGPPLSPLRAQMRTAIRAPTEVISPQCVPGT